MKLAEALAERAAAQTRLAELQGRLESGVLVQEGDQPAEDPPALLAEADQVMERLEWLVRAINATNAATPFDGDRTITDAIAARDMAARRQRFLSAVAAAAVPSNRFGRAEIKFVPVVDVRGLRAQADAAARAFRELDTRLQALNWTTDLVES
ncbi:MAG: DIP1984 family protein [Propionibacteriaceae bacterium]|nr:DIP1984 family protein [Propionibacteriaceae bacterium]